MSKKAVEIVKIIERLSKKSFLEKDILDLLNISQREIDGLSKKQKDQYKGLILGFVREEILKASSNFHLECAYASC